MPVRVALAGNPNSGKTTLFNLLTKSRAHVGNWPGVTVERRDGKYRSGGFAAEITDLPGVYSLAPYSPEEKVAGDFITGGFADVIIDVADATSIERSLYLTTELAETDIPVVVALNMMDAAKKDGINVDIPELEGRLGMPVVPISAAKKAGIAELMSAVRRAAKAGRRGRSVLEDTRYAPCLRRISALLGQSRVKNPLYFAAKIIENPGTAGGLGLKRDVSAQISDLQREAASLAPGDDAETDAAVLRYRFIGKCCRAAVSGIRPSFALTPSDRADRVLTHPLLGIPVFLLVMAAIFTVTFSDSLFGVPMPGAMLQRGMKHFADICADFAAQSAVSLGASDITVSLISGGVVGGMFAVLSFLPQILLLFLLMTLLEGSGYMARAAFIMDRPLRRVGLSGKSFVPMLMGFGCSVPAIAAVRTIENGRDRRLTALLVPFMSCGAKLPVYGLFALAFFEEHQGAVVLFIYLAGIFTALAAALILKKTVLRGDDAPFILELPPYRVPSLQNLAASLWEKLRHFLTKAGTVILAADVALWFTENFSFSLNMVSDPADSMLGTVGRAVSVVFVPLGFGKCWQLSVALLAGLAAKEAVVSGIGVMLGRTDAYGGISVTETAAVLSAGIISPAAALSYMVFNLFAPPCCAALAALRDELGTRRNFLLALLFYTAVAYAAAFVVYRAALLIM